MQQKEAYFQWGGEISGLDGEVYVARPYHSWERGANENMNGLIRQYFPKGTDFDQVTDEEIAEVERKLNLRPKKCLSYRAPLEVFCDGSHWQDTTPGGGYWLNSGPKSWCVCYPLRRAEPHLDGIGGLYLGIWV